MSGASLPAHPEHVERTDSTGLVVVIDDEPLLLRSLRRILQGDGHRIVLAESVEEAEATLQDPDLDVVMLDLLLGRTSGLELLERI